jgi:hypothetical protein
MAHLEQTQFCEWVRSEFPEYFKNVNVLDVGSLDINGNCRYLFKNSNYTGLDIGPGRNVDIVMPILMYAKVKPLPKYNVIVCCEMLEHDQHAKKSIRAMMRILQPGGLLIITAAYTGRNPHGTKELKPQDSPFTNHYYKNLTKFKMRWYLKLFTALCWKCFKLDVNTKSKDIYFMGIKK